MRDWEMERIVDRQNETPETGARPILKARRAGCPGIISFFYSEIFTPNGFTGLLHPPERRIGDTSFL